MINYKTNFCNFFIDLFLILSKNMNTQFFFHFLSTQDVYFKLILNKNQIIKIKYLFFIA